MEQTFITANGCAMRVADSKKGQHAIVLLHGYLESLDVWEDFARSLKRDFRVAAVDLPGHGISQVKGETHTMEFLADTVVATMDILGIDKFLPVGHSMGGYVVMELLRKYPERLAGIVLMHSTPNADSDEKKEARLREIALIDEGKKELLAHMAPEKGFAAANRKKFAADIAGLAELATLTDDDGITAILRGMMLRRDNNDTMRSSPLPQMVILGREDEHIPAEVAERLIAAQPQAEYVWLENCGHTGYLESPTLCAEAIVSFADRAAW